MCGPSGNLFQEMSILKAMYWQQSTWWHDLPYDLQVYVVPGDVFEGRRDIFGEALLSEWSSLGDTEEHVFVFHRKPLPSFNSHIGHPELDKLVHNGSQGALVDSTMGAGLLVPDNHLQVPRLIHQDICGSNCFFFFSLKLVHTVFAVISQAEWPERFTSHRWH